MALAPIEVLIYALAITGTPVPIACDMRPDKAVVCTNGMTVREDSRVGGMVFSPQKGAPVMVKYGRDGRLLFSNGVTASRTSAGWIKFSSGVEARRDMSGETNTFLVAPDLVCTEMSPTQASCKRR